MTKAGIDWHSKDIDWRYSNNEIGKKLGVTDQTVHRDRRKLKKPKSTIISWNPHPVEQ